MKLNRFFLIIIALIFWQFSFGQKKLDNFIKSLDNKNLNYDLVIRSPQFSDSMLRVSEYLIDIKSIDIKSLTEKFNNQKLLEALVNCLNDNNRDWYANMLLYAVTQKDITIFTVIEDRSEWIKNGNKDRDIKYWSNYQNKR